MAAAVVLYEFIFERQSYREESYPTLAFYAALTLTTAPLLFPYLIFWVLKEWASGRPPKVRHITKPTSHRQPMRCATPYLRNGGTIICQTGDIIEIVTREGTETMTVDEYEVRKSN